MSAIRTHLLQPVLRFAKEGNHIAVSLKSKVPHKKSFHHFQIRTLPYISRNLVPICMSHSLFNQRYDFLDNQYQLILRKMEKAHQQAQELDKEDLIGILVQLLHSGDHQEIPLYLLRWLDHSLAKCSWTLADSFFVMDSLSLLEPLFFYRGEAFQKFLDMWANKSHHPSSLALSLYFTNLVISNKVTSQKMVKFLENSYTYPCLNDWKVISFALTKSSNLALTDKLVINLYENMKSSFLELSPFCFKLFCKVLEKNHFNDPDSISLIRVYAYGHLKILTLNEIACFLNIFKTHRLYDDTFFFHMEERFISILSKLKRPTTLNICRDSIKILHCFASLNYGPNFANFFGVIAQFLRNFPRENQAFSFNYVRALHSLVIMGYFPKYRLLPLFTPTYLDNNMYNRSALELIHYSISVEASHLLPYKLPFQWNEKPGPCSNGELDSRPFLIDLEILAKRYAGEKISLKRVFSYIPISGILMKVTEDGEFQEQIYNVPLSSKEEHSDTGVKLAIELWDPTVSLHKGSLPTGQMALKLRQLHCLGFKVLSIKTSEVLTLLNLQDQVCKKELKKLIQSTLLNTDL